MGCPLCVSLVEYHITVLVTQQARAQSQSSAFTCSAMLESSIKISGTVGRFVGSVDRHLVPRRANSSRESCDPGGG
jgi:hypothetical protein